MSNPLPEQLLKEEYFHLQKTVEEFDQRSITIKNWSVTFAFAAIAGAFTSKAPIVFLVAAGASLGFWIVDALWKGFQYATPQSCSRATASGAGTSSAAAVHPPRSLCVRQAVIRYQSAERVTIQFTTLRAVNVNEV